MLFYTPRFLGTKGEEEEEEEEEEDGDRDVVGSLTIQMD